MGQTPQDYQHVMVLKLTLKEVAHPSTHNQQVGQDSHDHQEVMAQTIFPQDNNPHLQGFNTPRRLEHNDKLSTHVIGPLITDIGVLVPPVLQVI